LIVGVILLNLYFLGQLYFQHQNNQENEQPHPQPQHHHHHEGPDDFFNGIKKQDELVDKSASNANNLKNSNEFLVLDWTGHQHIFREQDPIKCKFIFSNINICCHLYYSILYS
jgi:CRISPR/Cas system-associated endonuclease/helicase Cas3